MSVTVLLRDEKDPQKQNAAINALGRGRSNAIGSVTLNADATSTEVTAVNCAPDSMVILFPQTPHAANDMATTNVDPSSVTQGAFVITHANNARTDRTFWYVCLG